MLKEKKLDKYLLKRQKIYKQLTKKNLKHFSGLFFYSKIKYFSEIKFLINLYLKMNIEIFCRKKYLNLDLSSKLLQKLPNVTPGGIIKPRKETQLIYNLIVVYMFKSIKEISNKIDKCAYPVIRIKFGVDNKKRPFATSKLHSDAWVGQYGDGIITFGIDGDFKNNGVSFYLPKKLKKNFFEKISDYNDGKEKYQGVKFISNSKKGYFVLFDHAVLHKTNIKKKAKTRVSIDFGIKMKTNIARKVIKADYKRWKYLDTR